MHKQKPRRHWTDDIIFLDKQYSVEEFLRLDIQPNNRPLCIARNQKYPWSPKGAPKPAWLAFTHGPLQHIHISGGGHSPHTAAKALEQQLLKDFKSLADVLGYELEE